MTAVATAAQLALAREARAAYRAGAVAPTSGVAHGLVQANLIAVPADWAFETLLFAQRNPKPMPVLEVLESGRIESRLAPGSDVRTTTACEGAGRLHGELVVSMRPIPASRVADAVSISGRYPAVHGAPVHVGDPASLGIRDLATPEFGDPPAIEDGDVPVFWACGVTPRAAIMASRPPFAVTHAPGHMLVTDVPDAELLQ
ncbi:MAG: D-glutamate cyclase family protein [Actinomycetota bacterium]